MEVHYISRQMQQNVTLILIQKSEDEITDPFSYLGQCQLCMNSVCHPVVYQKPKLSAETESFQLSAFGFGRRK